MTMAIAQAAAQASQLHWRWSVWLEAAAEELDGVQHVLWKLHPSFSPPEVLTTDRSSGFRLDSSGWGEFEIQAVVRLISQETITLRHWLRFEESGGLTESFSRSATEAVESLGVTEHVPRHGRISRRPKPMVFLSYTSSDARLAGAISRELKDKHNVDVLVDVDIPAGLNLQDWISEKITESDAAVFLLPKGGSASRSSSFTGYELGLAEKLGTQVIPILRSDTDIPASLQSSKAIRVSDGGSQDVVAQNIAANINDILG
jgi:TIR domain/YEATS family